MLDKILNHNIRKYPDRIAFANRSDSISYREVGELIRVNVIALKNVYKPGQRILLSNRKQLHFIIQFLSLIAAGFDVVIIDTEAGEDVVAQIQNRTNGVCLKKGIIRHCISGENYDKTTNMISIGNREVILMTSGSTGAPKLCVRSIKGLCKEGKGYQEMYKIVDTDSMYALVPVYHAFGMGGFFAAMKSGITFFVEDLFIPRRAMEFIREKKMSLMLLVPSMVNAMMKLCNDSEENLSFIRNAIVATGALPEKTIKMFERKFNIRYSTLYGTTEVGAVIANCCSGKDSSIGYPMNDVHIKILNGEENRGYLWVKSPNMFSGYLGDVNDNVDAEGYYSTGDIVERDQSGCIYILGRNDCFIKVGGHKISLLEIETVILKYTGIRDCKVVSDLDLNGEYLIRAYVVADNISAEEIRHHCMQYLNSYKMPHLIKFRDTIPRNSLGKIQFNLL